ncbi:delta-1-pyrroline-5-carboxylate dehydrogenase [Gonapodya prolifera JEL478]|uniref:Multifunctional fusion protein n=1 Tax=Gonapodya prolifera (strain JEL478) TaxID=1344416 RepID=A0A139AIA5_GONPJ|nr:delta-1-pyrroline-5-carboxylate dehydrogenase [Gonapodya prolifera JEL478]|eukprot:KXS16517.1 delta-1-pyrroline-5-carboxylate dehydrogenase [Gonapodya prolifera JEL478]
MLPVRTSTLSASLSMAAIATGRRVSHSRTLNTAALRGAQLGFFALPQIQNEPMRPYPVGSADRENLKAAIKDLRSELPFEVPAVINGHELRSTSSSSLSHQLIPFEHATVLAKSHEVDAKVVVERAIPGALEAKRAWETMSFTDRASIFLKAADLVANKYRYKILAATMLGQGKNVWQAEIDAAAELADFFRFNVWYAQHQIYSQQPLSNQADGYWNRVEYRPLEGFVAAVSPFNFTAIGGNLAGAPVLMGNVVLWKPSPHAAYSNHLVLQILREAGLPDGVIQFVPGPAEAVVGAMVDHPDFAGLHFTGSSAVFKGLYKRIAGNIDGYKNFPRIVGETGGKNMHFIHRSAHVPTVVNQTIRGTFEYSGQKCSATSRMYCPDSLWDEVKEGLVEGVKKIKVGPVDDFSTFVSAVIHKASFEKCKSYIEYAKAAPDAEILVGGVCDDSKGYYVHPTVIVTTNPSFKSITEEIFGPILTIYVYPADKYEETLLLADRTSSYALTAALFARDREAQIVGAETLRNCAGNFYINDKSTGDIVGQQPFGGSRASGTNDKAGAAINLLRWVSPRAVKENFRDLSGYTYPSNAAA